MDELYTDDICTTGAAPFEYAELLSRIDQLGKEIRKTSGKKGQKGKKKGGNKKLKKRLKALELQQEQLLFALQFIATQQQSRVAQQQSSFSWLPDTIKKALPAVATGIATAVIKGKMQPAAQPTYVMPAQAPLYLPDNSRR